MKIILFFFLNIFFLFSFYKSNAQSSGNSDSLFKIAYLVVNEISSYEKRIDNKKIIAQEVPYDDDYLHKTKVTVFLENDVVRKMVYNSYDESYTKKGTETYYFDSFGNLLCHINLVTGVRSYDIYQYPYFLVYYKMNDNDNALYKGETSAYVLVNSKFIVDYYLSFFENIKYKTFEVSKNTFPILKSLANIELKLLPKKNSAIVKNILKGTELLYLDVSRNKDNLNGKNEWAWYKVKTKQGQVGWIWGNPNLIKRF
jgi:hypothetical protein